VYAEERQQAIADLVSQRGRMSVNGLAREYAVTTETVRRDLSILEGAGIIRRVHGGAVPAESLTVLETAVNERDRANTEQKDRIAKAALQFLPRAGGSILVDAGTTTARLATHLPRDLRRTGMTNVVPLACRLAGLANLDLHLLPGRVRSTTLAAVGEETVDALQLLRTDVAFVGTNGVSLEHGLSTPDHSEAAAKRAMVGTTRQVVVLADSSKIGQEHTVRFAEIADIDALVTDSGIADAALEALRQQGVHVVVA
jgi:DeoR family transcriptional regulator, fructose operon transcriptional repressor